MLENNIVTMSLFKFEGRKKKWRAFQLMGQSPGLLKNISGMKFGKMLGSGARNGFSILPNFSVYGLMNVWEKEADALHYFQNNDFFQELKKNCSEYWINYMQTAVVHGEWEGNNPFTPTAEYNMDNVVGVLTRATIKLKYIPYFWRFVPKVSKSMDGHKEGLIFSVGIGELPLIQQATFSLWENSHFMKAYAYKNQYHREVIQKTRELGWYKEELFARFHPYKSEGNWEGKNPIKELIK